MQASKLTRLLISPLRIAYRSLPLKTRAWLRIRLNWLAAWIKDKLNRNNQLALAALIRNRQDICFPRKHTGPGVLVDITIVTYNSSKWIDSLFDSLCEQRYPLELLSVYVVDNESSDASPALLQGWRQKLNGRLRAFEIETHINSGFGTSQNCAISRGKADYVLVTNPDIQFEPESLLRIMGHAVSDDLSVASWELRQKPFEHPKHYDPVTLETNWSSHACILLRRSAWKAIGGYDEDIFMYAEDVEYSYRLRRAGCRLKYCPDAVIWHYTYDSIGQVKPLQYVGSIVGNLHIRMRYGSPSDMVIGLALAISRLFFRQPFDGARRRLVKQLARALLHAPAVLSSRRPTPAYFPFRRFDYELARQGAFLELGPSADNPPLVSIITRTYRGRASFLRQAAQTVLNQTYSRLEWIVVEDGGKTLLDSMIELQKQTGHEIRYFPLAKVGRSAAGNEGLRQARGEMVVFLDDDDLLYADHLEVLVAALANQPGCVAAYSLAWRLTTTTDEIEQVVDEHFDIPQLFFQPYCYETLAHHNYIPIQSIMFRRLLYLERGGFDVALDKLEDWNLWLRYGYRNQFVYVPKTTSLFRVPSDLGLMSMRQDQIDGAISDAVASAKRWCREYDATGR